MLFGRLNWARWIERKLRARSRFESHLPASSDVVSPSASVVANCLTMDGVCEGFTLSDTVLDQILRFADENPCYARDEQDIPFFAKDIDEANQRRSKDVLAAYYFSSVTECDAINRIVSDPRLLCIARNHLGQDARNIRSRLWWSFPAKRFDDADLHDAAQDRFHFDLNDWQTVKFFFYITDVDEASGPHIYIRGSHRAKSFRYQYTLLQGRKDADLSAFYGADAFQTITGTAGMGFAEDPFVFHTGSTARSTPRLILELEFGHRDLSASYRYGRLG